MRKWITLLELFNQQFDSDWKQQTDTRWTISFTSGGYSFTMKADYTQSRAWMIGFDFDLEDLDDDDFDKAMDGELNSGKGAEVFGFAIAGLRKFINQKHPDTVMFGPDTDAHDRLYISMLKRFNKELESLGYSATESKFVDRKVYKLTRQP